MNKKKSIMALVCIMVVLALGTVAVYAVGKLQTASSYTNAYVSINWKNLTENNKTPDEVWVKFKKTADGEVAGYSDIRVTKRHKWNGKKDIDTVYYREDKNDPKGYKIVQVELEPVDYYTMVNGKKTTIKDRFAFDYKITKKPEGLGIYVGDDYIKQAVNYYYVDVSATGKNAIGEVTLSKDFVKVNNNNYRIKTNGKQIKAIPIVKDQKGKTLVSGRDYTVTYSNAKRVNPGKYTITVKGKGKYPGNVTKNLIITPKPAANVKVRQCLGDGGYDDAYVTWTKSPYATGYEVYARRPNIKNNAWYSLGKTKNLYFTKRNLYDGYKYEFKVIPYYTSGDVNYRTTGSYKVVSMQTLKKLNTPSVTKYSNGKVKVTWNNILGESGYQISRSTSKTGTYILSSIPTTTGKYKVITSPKGTRYYKVRAYKNVVANGKTVKVYGPWSSVKMHKLV